MRQRQLSQGKYLADVAPMAADGRLRRRTGRDWRWGRTAANWERQRARRQLRAGRWSSCVDRHYRLGREADARSSEQQSAALCEEEQRHSVATRRRPTYRSEASRPHPALPRRCRAISAQAASSRRRAAPTPFARQPSAPPVLPQQPHLHHRLRDRRERRRDALLAASEMPQLDLGSAATGGAYDHVP